MHSVIDVWAIRYDMCQRFISLYEDGKEDSVQGMLVLDNGISSRFSY